MANARARLARLEAQARASCDEKSGAMPSPSERLAIITDVFVDFCEAWTRALRASEGRTRPVIPTLAEFECDTSRRNHPPRFDRADRYIDRQTGIEVCTSRDWELMEIFGLFELVPLGLSLGDTLKQQLQQAMREGGYMCPR
jgi:hypothetical protein